MTNTQKRRLTGSTALLLFMLAVLAAAFPHDSFWYDETVSAYLAQDRWETLWEWSVAIDVQPPLYFAALKLWSGVAGSSEFALRVFSFLVGVLGLAGMIQLGRLVTGRLRGGWVAALTLLFSGGFLYAFGEVRTYALALSAAIWSCAFLLITLRQETRPRLMRYGALYTVATLASLYAHYTAVFMVATQGVYVLLRYGLDLRKLLVFVPAGLLFAPWMLAVQTQGVPQGLAYEGVVPVEEILRTYWEFFLYGQVIPDADADNLALVMAALLGAYSLFLLWRRRLPLLGALLTVLPILGLMLAIFFIEGKLSGRHGWGLWIGAPLLVGMGATAISGRGLRLTGSVVALGIVLILARERAALPDQYPSQLEDAFAYVETHAAPNDLLILRDGTLFTAAYYYDTPIAYIGLPNEPLTDIRHKLSFHEGLNLVRGHLPAGAESVWVLSWQGDIMDPQEMAYGLAEYAGGIPVEQRDYGDVTLTRYRIQRDWAVMIDHIAAFPGVIQIPPEGASLLGVDVYHGGAGCPVIFHAWWWRGTRDYPDARVSYRLTDGGTQVYSVVDETLSGAFYPQSDWLPFVPTLGRAVLTFPQGVESVQAEMRVYDLHGDAPEQPIILQTLTPEGEACAENTED